MKFNSQICTTEEQSERLLALGLKKETARKFESYLIGDAELPEVFDDNGHLKELFEVAQKEMDKINKRNDEAE